MSAFKDIFASERGILTLIVILAVTILAVLGVANYSQWSDFVKFSLGVYVASKTVTGATQIIKGADTATPANPGTPS